jgi:general secretion pathway protein K
MNARVPRRPGNGPRRERGVALLVALLAVALAVILIAGLLDRGELGLARTRNALRSAQALAYAQGLEAYAASVLLADQATSQDSRTDTWALPLPPQEVPGGVISATLRDLNGCFNLNNLVLADDAAAQAWRETFARLLAIDGVDPGVADAVVDWLDADANTSGSAGAEDGAYLGQALAYRAANRAFAQVSELRLVRGVDGDAYARLAPDVCALPAGTRLNLNTASVAVLQSLAPGISRSLAERLWQDGNANWVDRNAFFRELPDGGATLGALKAQLGLASRYFLARGEVVLDDVPFTFHSLIERRAGSGIRVLARSRGSDDALTTRAFDPAPDTTHSRRVTPGPPS